MTLFPPVMTSFVGDGGDVYVRRRLIRRDVSLAPIEPVRLGARVYRACKAVLPGSERRFPAGIYGIQGDPRA